MEHHGQSKFPNAGLLLSSEKRNWGGIAAELRSHPAGEISPILPAQMEITLAVRGSAAGSVERRGDGVPQETATRPGTLWFCPIGVQEDSIRITKAIPEVLHLYLPGDRFEALAAEAGMPIRPSSIFYMAGVDDELVRQISYTILRELRDETAGGRLLADSLSLGLAVHLANSYSSFAVRKSLAAATGGQLEGRRLQRVLDYIEDNPESSLTVSDLAAVACLSPFHFTRAFRKAKGSPPHRYVSAKRLGRARQLLRDTDDALADIALACSFSSQASFTKAFRRATGTSPGEYRRQHAG